MPIRIFVVFLLLSRFNSAYSQYNSAKEVVSVKIDIVGKGAPANCANADTSDYYLAIINVLNTQDTTVTFWIMSCSWPIDGFVIHSDSIAFRSCFAGCDKNIPEKISLPPKKMIQFYTTIKSWKKDPSVTRITLGFRYFRTVDELWFSDGSKKSKNLYKIIWSNEVELKDNLYGYEIK